MLGIRKIIKYIRCGKQAYKASIYTIFKTLIILVENKFQSWDVKFIRKLEGFGRQMKDLLIEINKPLL